MVAARLDGGELADEDGRDRPPSPAPCTQRVFGAQDAARDEAHDERLVADDERVPGVGPAGVAHDHVRRLGVEVDDLALAFVPPLRADDHDRGHRFLLFFHPALTPRGRRASASGSLVLDAGPAAVDAARGPAAADPRDHVREAPRRGVRGRVLGRACATAATPRAAQRGEHGRARPAPRPRPPRSAGRRRRCRRPRAPRPRRRGGGRSRRRAWARRSGRADRRSGRPRRWARPARARGCGRSRPCSRRSRAPRRGPGASIEAEPRARARRRSPQRPELAERRLGGRAGEHAARRGRAAPRPRARPARRRGDRRARPRRQPERPAQQAIDARPVLLPERVADLGRERRAGAARAAPGRWRRGRDRSPRPRSESPRRLHRPTPRARAPPGRPPVPGGAVQLDAGLGHLPVTARAPLPAAHDGALVAEPDRPRLPPEARRHHARDLRRHVGAERGDLARLGLDEAEHVRRVERAEAALEHLRELERGRRDELVAVEGEVIEHTARERAAAPRSPRGGDRACPRAAGARALAADRPSSRASL